MVLDVQKPSDPRALTIEAWAQGFMTGGLIIMAAITVANMRRKVLLHKLILIEVSSNFPMLCRSFFGSWLHIAPHGNDSKTWMIWLSVPSFMSFQAFKYIAWHVTHIWTTSSIMSYFSLPITDFLKLHCSETNEHCAAHLWNVPRDICMYLHLLRFSSLRSDSFRYSQIRHTMDHTSALALYS